MLMIRGTREKKSLSRHFAYYHPLDFLNRRSDYHAADLFICGMFNLYCQAFIIFKKKTRIKYPKRRVSLDYLHFYPPSQ